MTNHTSTLITDDESLADFWANYPDSENRSFSIDLMAAHPDRAEASGGGFFEVSVAEVVVEGVTYFAAVADDGDDGWDWPSAPYYIAICDDEVEAREAADQFIEEWNFRWSY